MFLYFGYPQAHEDDAERAVRAGLELIRALGRLKSSAPLQIRVGITTGLVVVGDLIESGAAREQTVVARHRTSQRGYKASLNRTQWSLRRTRDVVLLVLCWELDCPWVTGGVSVGMPSEVRRALFLDVLLLTPVTGVLCLLCNHRRASTSEIFRSWVVSRTVMPTCVFRFVGYWYLLSTRPVTLTHCPRQLLSGAT